MVGPGLPEFVGEGDRDGKNSPAGSLRSPGSSGESNRTSASVAAADLLRKEELSRHSVALDSILTKIDVLKRDIELEELTLEEGEAEFKMKSEDLEQLRQEEGDREASPEEKKELKQLRTKLDRDASSLKRHKVQTCHEISALEREIRKLITAHEAVLSRIDLEEEQMHEAKTAELREKYQAMMNQKLDVTVQKDDGSNVQDNESVYFDSQEVPQEPEDIPSVSEPQQQESMASALHAIAKILTNQEAKGQSSSVVDKVLIRQSIGKDLPIFNGKCEQWHTFISSFENTTKLGGYDNASNVERLRRCLKGEALRCVETLLVSGDSLDEVMATLKMRFGQPEIIVTSLIEKTRACPQVKDGVPQSIIDFGTSVKNLVTTIKNLKMDGDLANPALLREFKNKLPYRMKVDWDKEVLRKTKESNLIGFSSWLDEHVQLACMNYVPKGEDDRPKKNEDQKSYRKSEKSRPWDFENPPPIAAGLAAGKQDRGHQECLFCEGSHDATRCGLKISIKQKKAKIAEAKACYICLKRGHFATKCRVAVKCDSCAKRHQTIMCDPGKRDQQQETTGEEGTTSVNSASVTCTKAVLLKTVVVRVKGPKGSMLVRLMSDEGSQTSLVGRKVVDELGLRAVGSTLTRNVLCGGLVTPLHEEILREVTIESLDGKVQRTWTLNEKQAICPGLPRIPSGPWINQLKRKKIFLSDWDQAVVDDTDVLILIGSDHWGELVTKVRVDLSEDFLAVKTLFGWCLSGCLPRESFGNVHVQMAMAQATIQDLWSLESIGIMDKIEPIKEEELALAAKKDFELHVRRRDQPEGKAKYEVALPWMVENPELPTNKNVAEKRLESATKKMQANDQVSLYDNVFKAWLEEGIIEEVPDEEMEARSCHYIPHRAVFKPQSLTTPVRPVFDASCKVGRLPSLNECLHKGPNLIALIPEVLYRFREKAIGVTADIRKAFQMIEVRKEDRDYLRFFWWEDPSCKKMQVYRHLRVVFGLTCSPFLLAAVLEKHCREVGGARDKAKSDQLSRSLYVDNCLTSVNSMEEYSSFKDFSINLLGDCQMELREWGYGPSKDAEDKVANVLGMIWNKQNDTMSVKIPPLVIDSQITMRGLLSAIHSVFDPVGFLSPVLLQPKLLLQQGWDQKKSMDQPLCEEDSNKFRKWYDELPVLTNYGIPRRMLFGKEGLQLHCFVDASKDAYACVVYARSIEDGVVKVRFIHSKARVAPLKKGTIPRLELMACWMGAELCQFIVNALGLEEVPVYFWSDSSTALSWIKMKCEWGTFVGNRVKKILEKSSPHQWRFIPGVMNPADLPSRGCSPEELLKTRWEEGPTFLLKPESEWPQSKFQVDEELVTAEVKKTAKFQCSNVIKEKCWFYDRDEKKVSTFKGNVKVMGWVQRFVANAKNSTENRKSGPLKQEELRDAKEVLLKIVQDSCEVGIREESGGLNLIKVKSLWRVKTRLLNKKDTEEFKLPVFLPKSHPLVSELIREYHEKFCHAGAQIMLSKMRESYWVEHGRRTVKKVIKRCLKCQRDDVKHLEVPPSDLPTKRVEDVEVFTTTGVDLAGPLQLKDDSKVWIVVYTCAVYRCVIFDLVTSLSTEAFLSSLERFVNTYGRPATIYSDNGTNFVGAANLMRRVDWRKIQKESDVKQIRWIFNPPSAPWWGGWWERLIRSAKDLLRRTLGKASLTFDQFRTCLTGVAATMNDRPLTLIGEDPEDLIPLTPAMFLHPTRNSQMPEGEKLHGRGLNKQYRRVQVLKRELQERFRSEYLSQLVHRGKDKTTRVPEVGEVVLIGSDNRKRWEWPLGRIIELLPGKDKETRTARVKTRFGILTRPLQRLYPLEFPTSLELPVPPELPVAPEVRTIAQEEQQVPEEVPVVTRSGRRSKKPCRYGVWNHQFQ